MRNYALGTVNTLLRHLIQLVIKIDNRKHS